MLEFARSEFRVGARQPDGNTLREHLLSVARQTGQTPQALVGDTELPEDADYLWNWFNRLSNRRQVGMAPGPLTWPQIEAFFRLMKVRADEWELRALELLDNAWLESLAEERGKQK